MSRKFHIERVGNLNDLPDEMGEHVLNFTNPIIHRYNSYGLMFEDLRTVIELNKTIEDVLTEKYLFFKMLPLSKMRGKRDFEEAKLELETYNTLLVQSLFTTSIVTYARWFTQSTGKRPKLEPSEVFKNWGKRTKLTHEVIMLYRHHYFAHTGETHMEQVYPLYVTDPRQPDEEHLFHIPQKKRLPTLTEVRSFDRLFKKVITHVQSKMRAMKPRVIKVMKEEIEKKKRAKKKS
jgi:hypothetical protein